MTPIVEIKKEEGRRRRHVQAQNENYITHNSCNEILTSTSIMGEVQTWPYNQV